MPIRRVTIHIILATFALVATTTFFADPLFAFAQSAINGSETGANVSTTQDVATSSVSTAGGIAIDIFGNVFVADGDSHSIKKYDTTGRFLLSWGSPGTGPGQFSGPISVTTDSTGAVYILDGGNQRVQTFDGAGNFITSWTYAAGPANATVPLSGNITYPDDGAGAGGDGGGEEEEMAAASAGNDTTSTAGSGAGAGGGDGTVAP